MYYGFFIGKVRCIEVGWQDKSSVSHFDSKESAEDWISKKESEFDNLNYRRGKEKITSGTFQIKDEDTESFNNFIRYIVNSSHMRY